MSKIKAFKDFASKPVNETTGDVGGIPNEDEATVFNTPEGPMSVEPVEDDIPALFATIHFKSDDRPNGYTMEDIEEMNRLANSRLRGVRNNGDTE